MTRQRLRSTSAFVAMVALVTLCLGGTCRYETVQAVTTTFLNELAVSVADAIFAAISSP